MVRGFVLITVEPGKEMEARIRQMEQEAAAMATQATAAQSVPSQESVTQH